MDAKLLFVFLIVKLAFCDAYPRRAGKNYEEALAASRVRRGWLDCKEESAQCYGFPPCCGEMVCFWENGWSPRTPGVCVECVDRGQRCQRDSQCCGPLVCQKPTTFTTDGTCDVKLPLGAECHDNDQCESEFCQIHWYNDVVMGHGGKCANPAA